MKHILSALFLLAGISTTALAQVPALKGKLIDADNRTALQGATVSLSGLTDTTVKLNVITNREGEFSFSNMITQPYQLRITQIGYDSVSREIQWDQQTQDLGMIVTAKTAKELSGVTVVGRQAMVQMKGDTIQMNADQFKVNPDATSEDLLRKAPGITIENGTVKAGGEQVQKVTVDGRDFFGDDAAATLRNLPAEVVDKIQVFDRLSDQAQVTGIDDGNTSKSINIVTKVNMRNGQFGRVFAGFGTDNHYLAGGNMSFFNGARRLSVVALANDVNQQNFTELDLLGATGGGGRGGFQGGGGGRGGMMRGGGGGGFLIGQQPGVNKTYSLGLNYNDEWSKKLNVSGSYFFNLRNSANDESNFREYSPVLRDSVKFYDQSELSSNKNYNHRANFRFDYKIDSFNSILITPSINIQNYSSSNSLRGLNLFDDLTTQSQTENFTTSERNAVRINNNILYRHNFRKPRRTFSVNLRTGMNNSDGENYLDAFTTYFKGAANINDSTRQFRDQLTTNYDISANINYSEPVGKRAMVQFQYSPSFNINKADQKTYEFENGTGKYSDFDTSLSNVFESSYNTHRGGITYRMGDRNKSLSFGLDGQTATLNSDRVFPVETSVKRNFTNLLPSAMISYPLSTRSSVRLFYRTSTNPPSVNQLQDVINYNNPLQISTGNPNLEQQYAHRLGLRFQFANTQKGQSLFLNFFGTKTDDYVGTAVYRASADSVLTPTVTLFRGSQLTKPVNIDGQYNLNTFVTFGMPLLFIKSNVNLNAGVTYNKTPGLINNIENMSTSINYNAGIVLSSNISEFVDFTLNYSASLNNAEFSLQPNNNQRFISQNGGFRLNLMSKNGWVFNNDINNQNYSGLTDGFNQNFWLWNMAVAKKFLKNDKGELRLSVFDLLNQNQSITRTVTESYIEDQRTQVVKQYFMLTFTMNLKNFGTPAQRNNNRDNENMRMRF